MQLLKDRYKELRGYKFDRIIFKSVLYVFLFFICGYLYINNFDLDYFNCPLYNDGSIKASSKFMVRNFERGNLTDGYCKNPFYKESWKNTQFLPAGEYGKKPSLLLNYMPLVGIAVILYGFILNHFVHNRKFGLLEKLKEVEVEDGKDKN